MALTLPVLAQEAEEDRGFLTGYIEENLSGAGREVRLEGFAGALSSRATFDTLTIADGKGVWLTIRDGAISWNRSALLRGRVEVGELSAASIDLDRRPEPEADPGLPDPEARPFRLPELPVSVKIGSVQAGSVHLAEPVLGSEVTLKLDGSLSLEGGEGSAKLAVARTDGTVGALSLDTSFVNTTEMLKLDLGLFELEGGIAATLLNLPGRPAMELHVNGEGPLSDFTAEITLDSGGERRLSGEARLTADASADPPTRSFALDVAGDLAPLFLAEYRPFFGPDVRLTARGTRTGEGETRLDELSLKAAVVNLDGNLTLAADGLPRSFTFDAKIAAPGGGPVRLPLAGPIAEVEEARIELSFDAAAGDAWNGAASLRGFRLGSDLLGEANVTAEGEISRGGDGRRIGARVGLEAREIALADPALAEAVGRTLDAAATLAWREGQPLALSDATAETENARLVAYGSVGPLAEGLPFAVRGTANIPDLAAFSALAGRPLGGRLILSLNGTTHFLDGRFDLRAGGVGRDVSAGIEPFDRAIAGQSRFGLDARRDETGLLLRRFEIASETARIAAAGTLRAGATEIDASARFEEAGRVLPGLAGPAAARAQVRETGPGVYDLSASAEAPGEASLAFSGLLRESAQGVLSAEGRLTARVARLAAYADLARRPLRGAVELTAEGAASLTGKSFDLALDLTGEDLALGEAALDRVLRGTATLSAEAAYVGEATTIRRFALATREITAEAAGSIGRAEGRIVGGARLRDLAVLAPDFAGPLAVTGALELASDGSWTTDFRATGPGDLSASATGRLAPDPAAGPGAYSLSASAEAPGEASLAFEGALRENADGALSGEGRLTASVARLAAYAGLARRPLGGTLALAAEGSAALADRGFDLVLDVTGRDLSLGQPTIDRLLGGTATLSAAAARAGETTRISRFALATREIAAEATGAFGRTEGRIEGEARLRDLAVLAPDFPGPLVVSGALSRAEDGSWGADLRATGPGGTTGTVAGRIAPDLATADLALAGAAPLGLANAAIAPRAVRGQASFDLRLSGRPGLEALSGRIATSGARLVAPTYGLAVAGIEGAVTLSGGAAVVDLGGAVEGGGRVSVAGSLGLGAPNAADLRVTLAGARIAEPELFETEVSGALTVTGPLQGGGLIAGALDVGTTEVRVAATGLGTGDVPEGMRHRSEPAAVRLTRVRAGLLETGADGVGDGRPFALDLLIRAPNRIFLRGRGLDAELGGVLRLSGTTAALIPQGQFDLIRGRLDILGRRFAFDEGLARLEGSFDPYVRLVAVTEADDITARIVVEGPASDPEIRFESAPELPEDEVLARLFFGRGLSELSPLQAARLASAVAQLSGRGGAGVVDRLRQTFGLDDLDITTDTEGGTAVRAGRYLSENLYTEVTVGSESKSEVSINLDLSRSFTVKGRVDSEGETGLGVFFERDY